MTDTSTRPGGRALRCGWPVLLLLLAGCSSQGTITGKVTYQGNPLPSGTVTFVPEQGGQAVTCDIRDGEYKVTKISPGPAKIAVSTPSNPGEVKSFINKMQPPEMKEKMAPGKSPPAGFDKSAEPPKPVPIPKKFNDPNNSGLTYTVKSGSQVHDIDLPAK
jgi:hypothetical protein